MITKEDSLSKPKFKRKGVLKVPSSNQDSDQAFILLNQSSKWRKLLARCVASSFSALQTPNTPKDNYASLFLLLRS
jgi:hypothetical protein